MSICLCFHLPRVRAVLYSFLPILSPSVTIVQDVISTSGLECKPRSAGLLGPTTTPLATFPLVLILMRRILSGLDAPAAVEAPRRKLSPVIAGTIHVRLSTEDGGVPISKCVGHSVVGLLAMEDEWS